MNSSDAFLDPCETRGQTRRCLSAVEPGSLPAGNTGSSWDAEEEEDRFLGVPLRRACGHRAAMQAYDPFRRHSWEPGKKLQGAAGYEQMSASLKGLDPPELDSSLETLARLSRQDPRRTPMVRSIDTLESLLSQDEDDEDLALAQDGATRPGQGSMGTGLSKSVSLSGIDIFQDKDDISLFVSETSLADSFSLGSCGQLDATGEAGQPQLQYWEATRLGRTLSFIKKMTGKAKNKEKEKMKEREKEKDARYTNGHLFTTISVSGTTLCFACNKSITAKEALICPTCNVTIHNRCKDTLPNCTKVKQKQQKAALLKNNAALQSVCLRNKSLRERPNSAIYPSESFRQSLLGSRRARPTLSLSKSVSTTNIAGTFNDESPLGLRRILSQSTDSLNARNRTLSVESLIDEGAEVLYSQLMSDLEPAERDFAADSWSLAVDSSFLQQHRKDVMKRQDVIYELIQTELHHVRTLKIMGGLFRKGMLEDLQMEPGQVHRLFPCVDELSDIHQRFLAQLLERRHTSLAPGSPKNFVINRLGDLLVQQFSGTNAEQLKKAYAEFCSQHNKASKLYKELLAREKRFQQFIRKLTRLPVLRRHGVPECILLVTQRITKYPVLIDRILQNSKGNEAEQQDLSTALVLVKDLLSAIDQEVHDSAKSARLREIHGRLDGRARVLLAWEGRNAAFGRDELLRRRLVHDGSLLWKMATGRFKDVLVLLMTDVLIFLQEKDQKFTFPALDKPAVISLQNLIVRDIANQEKGMFLISAAPPEMYEVHAASREDRNTWMRLIQHTVSLCPSRQDFPLIETETEASMRKLKDRIANVDQEVAALLEEKVMMFTDMLNLQSGLEELAPAPGPRTLFRSESAEVPRGEKLIQEAIREVECLKDLILGTGRERDHSQLDPDGGTSPTATTAPNGEAGPYNGTLDFSRPDHETAPRDGNGNQLQQKGPQEEVLQHFVTLYTAIHSLQAIVAQQDTLLELRLQEGLERRERLSRAGSQAGEGMAPGPRAPERGSTELGLLQRQHTLVQEELARCRQLCQDKVQEVGLLETRLRDSEQSRLRLERELEQARRQLDGARRVPDPRRRSLPAGDALYLSFTPPQSHVSDQGSLSPPFPRPFSSSRDEPTFLAPPARLQEGDDDLDPLSEDEASASHPSPPSSPRDFPRMQDIPEEVESSQELRDGEGAPSDS
ncbi:rho guanine nucleotide exchange factor 2 isoform X2 [Alligator mississippiensis]|uniref:rho guanine nucleotide exchange factor 2 isoform X2 n=1 Tax=Alligator mississippiensis TaxID=8496 RepID=UPI0007116EFA|nr:rho guanine nucleotide exchange factor 2 isoform X2 [Alligator mississippiensis]